MHICEIPVRGREGTIWRCEECNQCWRRVDGRWNLTMLEAN